MFTTTVRRLAADGPFKVGALYGIAAGDEDAHFTGVVQDVTPIDDRWVEVTVGMTDDEHRRLLALGR